MNLELLEKEYITEMRELASKAIIKECEKEIEKEKLILKKRSLIEEIFTNLLNSSSLELDETCNVIGKISREKQDPNIKFRLDKNSKTELEYMSCFLNYFEVENKIIDENDKVFLVFSVTLEEKEKIENYLSMKGEQKILKK